MGAYFVWFLSEGSLSSKEESETRCQNKFWHHAFLRRLLDDEQARRPRVRAGLLCTKAVKLLLATNFVNEIGLARAASFRSGFFTDDWRPKAGMRNVTLRNSRYFSRGFASLILGVRNDHSVNSLRSLTPIRFLPSKSRRSVATLLHFGIYSKYV